MHKMFFFKMVKDRLFIKLLEDVYYPKIFALKCQQTTFFFPTKRNDCWCRCCKENRIISAFLNTAEHQQQHRTKRELFPSSIHLRLLFMGGVTLAAGSEGYSGSPSP